MAILEFIAGTFAGIGLTAMGAFAAGRAYLQKSVDEAVDRSLGKATGELKRGLLEVIPVTTSPPPPSKWMQEKEAEIIAETYSKLTLINSHLYELNGLQKLLADDASKEHRGALTEEYQKINSHVEEAVVETFRYVQKNGIYFKGELATQLSAVQSMFLKTRTAHWATRGKQAAMVSLQNGPAEIEKCVKLLDREFKQLFDAGQKR